LRGDEVDQIYDFYEKGKSVEQAMPCHDTDAAYAANDKSGVIHIRLTVALRPPFIN
jgi:hypothetical protein